MNPTDAETFMLLTMHLLALGMACMIFVWMVSLHRRRHKVETLTPHRDTIPSFEAAFATRPAVWMAVRAPDPKQVQAALGLNHSTPCSWSEGMTGEREFFIGPPVNHWIIVTGAGIPNPSCDVDKCFRFLTKMSRQLGLIQFFHADRVLHHHAWARVENGVVIRAYAWAGETIWNQGPKTGAETDLSMKCFGYGEEPSADSWALVEWTTANVGKVPLLAARWSLDPARINERVLKAADGIAGNTSRA